MDTRSIHSTSPKLDLMEFFDDPKNWGAREVKSGRSWKIDELRLKSNVDLQKLWFVGWRRPDWNPDRDRLFNVSFSVIF